MEAIPSVRLVGSPLAAAYGATDARGVPIDDRNSDLGAVAQMRAAMKVGTMSRVAKGAASVSTPAPTSETIGRLGLAVTRASDPAERAKAAEDLSLLVLKAALHRGGGHLGRQTKTAAEQLADARTAITKATTPEGRTEAALVAIMKAATSLPPGVPVAEPTFRPNGNVNMGTSTTLADIVADVFGDSTEENDDLDMPLGGVPFADAPTGIPRVDPRKLPRSDGVRARGVRTANRTVSDERQAIPNVLDTRSGTPARILKAAAIGRRLEAAEGLMSASRALHQLADVLDRDPVLKAARGATRTPARATTAAGRSVTFPVRVSLG